MGLARTYSIGRDANADLPIADDSVSRLHAQAAVLGPDELFLNDCGSTNGTWLVGTGGEVEAIRQANVRGNQSVRFGSVTICVRDLLEAVSARQQRGAGKATPPPKPVRAKPLAHSTRLVRCGCGAVRTASDECVLCGEK